MAINLLKDEEETLSNTNLQIAEAPVEEQEQILPVVEEPKGVVPRVGEEEGFVDTRLVSQTPIVNDTEPPAESFVTADMPKPVVKESPEVVQERPEVIEDASAIDPNIPKKPSIREQVFKLREASLRTDVPTEERLDEEKVVSKINVRKGQLANERFTEAQQELFDDLSYDLWNQYTNNTGLKEEGVTPVEIMYNLDAYTQLLNNKGVQTKQGEALRLFNEKRIAGGPKQSSLNKIRDNLLNFYIEEHGEDEGKKLYARDMQAYREDMTLRIKNFQVENGPGALGDLVERYAEFGFFDIIDFAGITVGEGSLREFLPNFITGEEIGEKEYDELANALQIYLNNKEQMDLMMSPKDDTDFIDSVIFPEKVPESPGFFDRLRIAAGQGIPNRLKPNNTFLKYGPTFGAIKTLVGVPANFVSNMPPPSPNDKMEAIMPGYGRYIDNMAFWAGISTIEAPAELLIRRAFKTSKYNAFLDGGAEELLKVTNEINEINGGSLKSWFKTQKLERKKRKLQSITNRTELGSAYQMVERDVNYSMMAFGLGYTGLDLLGVKDGSGGQVLGLLMAGIFGPAALQGIHKLGKGTFIGSTARIDFYLEGGGTIDGFILNALESGDSSVIKLVPDLKEKLPTMSEGEKLALIKLDEQEFRAMVRFGEVLNGLRDNPNTRHLYKTMQENMTKVSELKKKMLKLMDMDALRGKEFVDVDGTISVYDDATLARYENNVTLFLDEYINSEVIKSIREAMQSKEVSLNMLGRIDRGLFKSDLERYLKLDVERNDNLAEIFRQISPVFQEAGEAGKRLNDKFNDMLKIKREGVEAANQNLLDLENIIAKEKELEQAAATGGDVFITKLEANAQVETYTINDVDFNLELEKNPIEAITVNGEQLEFNFPLNEKPSQTIIESATLIKSKKGEQGITFKENGDRQKELFKDSIFSSDKSKFDEDYAELRGRNLTVNVDQSKIDVEEGILAEPTLKESASEKVTKTSYGDEILNERTTDEAGNLVITYGDGATETIPAANKLPTENNLPSDIRADEGVYTFGRGQDADRQVFPSTKEYDTLESFITSNDEALSGFDTKQRLRFWRISRDGADPLKEGYIPKTELDANDPFVIQNDLINLENQMAGLDLPLEDVDRFKRIHEGGKANQTNIEEVSARRTERIKDASEVKNISEEESAAIIQRIIEVEEDIMGGQALPIPRTNLGKYLVDIRKAHIDSYDDPVELGRYIQSRVEEIKVIKGSNVFKTDDSFRVEALLKRLNEGGDIDEAKIFRDLRILGKRMLADQADASVLVNANDLHRIRSHYNDMAFKNYGTTKGQEYRAYGSSIGELMNDLFPEYAELNNRYRVEFAEIYKSEPFASILNKRKGFPKVPEYKIIDAFFNADDALNSVNSFKRLINKNLRADGQIGSIIIGDPKKIAKDRKEAYDLLFYNIAKRMQNNIELENPAVDPKLKEWLRVGMEEGIFSVNPTNSKSKIDHNTLVKKIMSYDGRSTALTRSTSESLNLSKARLQASNNEYRAVSRDSRIGQIQRAFSDAGIDEDKQLAALEGLTSGELKEFVSMLAKVYKKNYKLSNLISDRPNQPMLMLDKQGDQFIDFKTGNIDAEKLVENDIRNIINKGMHQRFIKIDNGSQITDITRDVFQRLDYVINPGSVTKTQPYTIDPQTGKKVFPDPIAKKFNTVIRRGDVLKVDELNAFIKKNTSMLEYLYSKEHIKNLEDITQMGIVISNPGKGDAALKGIPRTMQVPAWLSRLFAWQRGVIGTKYLASEIGMNRFRKSQSDAIQRMIQDPEAVIVIKNLFDAKTPIKEKDLTKAVGVLKTVFLMPENRSDADLKALLERALEDNSQGRSIEDYDNWAQTFIDNNR